MALLDLFKRSESGTPLTQAQFDSNYTEIEARMNERVETTDPRLSNARTPTAHTHLLVDIPEAITQLGLKATTTALSSLDARVVNIESGGGGAVLSNDARLTNARAIADGNYTLFTVASGVATLVNGIVGPTKLAAGDYGAITFAAGAFTIDSKTVAPAALTDTNFGAFTVLNGISTINNTTITLAMLANADFGPFTKSAGVITLDPGVVTLANLADADYGMISKVSGSFQIDAGVVTPSMLANTDFGAFAISSGVASLNDATTNTQFIAGTANKSVTALTLNNVYKPRVVTPVSGAVGFDANGGLFVIVPEGANNLVHDSTPWTNLPLDKEIDVWIFAGATARTNTWATTGSNLILATSGLEPYNQTNCWKHFIYRWLPDPANITTKFRRVVIFAGNYS